MIIVRTSAETIDNVVLHMKHALNGRPKLSPGEKILIAQTKSSLPYHKEPIQYLMEFEQIYYDKEKESLKIWGKFWPYIIKGKNCKRLKTPFDINRIQTTNKNYGRGGPIVYVERKDEDIIINNGLLDTI